MEYDIDFRNSAVADLFDKPIAFNRAFLRFGGINAALMLSQAFYWQNQLKEASRKEDGWWYHSSEDWLEETGLTQDMLASARTKLVEAGVLEYRVSGMPARSWYRVNGNNLMKQLLEYKISMKKPCAENPKHVLGNSQNKNEEIPETELPEIPNPNRIYNISYIKENTIDNNLENIKKNIKKKSEQTEHSELFDLDEAPTREEMDTTKRRQYDAKLREEYNRIHEIAGLSEPVVFKKSDKELLDKALRKGISVERIGEAWKKALSTSEACYWPFHCVIEKLPTLEAVSQPKKKSSSQQTQNEIQASIDRAWKNAFGGALCKEQQ